VPDTSAETHEDYAVDRSFECDPPTLNIPIPR